MQGPMGMSVVNGLGDGQHVLRGLLSRQRFTPDHFGQVTALDVIHRKEVFSVVLANLVDRDNVGVLKIGRCLGLDVKAANCGVIRQSAIQNHFDGHHAVQSHLAGFIDNAHASTGNLSEQLVVTEIAYPAAS